MEVVDHLACLLLDQQFLHNFCPRLLASTPLCIDCHLHAGFEHFYKGWSLWWQYLQSIHNYYQRPCTHVDWAYELNLPEELCFHKVIHTITHKLLTHQWGSSMGKASYHISLNSSIIRHRNMISLSCPRWILSHMDVASSTSLFRQWNESK